MTSTWLGRRIWVRQLRLQEEVMLMRWIGLLALALALAASAFVGTAPAMAASEWTMGGKPLTETASAEFDGELAVGTPMGTVSCFAGFRINVAASGKATAETWAYSPTKCALTGSLKSCFVTGGKATSTPWAVDTLTKDWDITNVKIDYTFERCTTK